MQEKSAIIFQFVVMGVLTGILFLGFITLQEWNEIALGALIGSFVGLPQAFQKKVE